MTHQDWQTQKRLQAVRLYYNKQWQQKMIAEALGVTKGAISQWVKKVKDIPEEQWEQVLQVKKSTGRKPCLTNEQGKVLLILLEEGAEKCGFTGDFWTLSRLCQVTKRNIGVSIGTTGMYGFLQRSGYSCKKPQKIAKERNDTAVAGFKGGWSNLKKGQ
jgi:transposase